MGIASGPWRRVEACRRRLGTEGGESSSRAEKRVRGRGLVGFADWLAEILSTRPRFLGRNVACPCLGPALGLVTLSRRGALGVILPGTTGRSGHVPLGWRGARGGDES